MSHYYEFGGLGIVGPDSVGAPGATKYIGQGMTSDDTDAFVAELNMLANENMMLRGELDMRHREIDRLLDECAQREATRQ